MTMFSAAINGSFKALARELERTAKAIEKGTLRAQNRSITQARNEASREIRADTRYKAGAVKKNLTVVKARRNQPVAKLQSKYRGFPLSGVAGARQTKKGVSFQAIRTKPRALIAHGFKTTFRTGHTGFVIRSMQGGKRVGRSPVQTLYAPPVVDRFEAKLPAIQERAMGIFANNLQHEIDFALGKIQ